MLIKKSEMNLIRGWFKNSRDKNNPHLTKKDYLLYFYIMEELRLKVERGALTEFKNL